MIMGLRGSSGYLNSSSKAETDSESEEEFEVERYSEALHLKNQCTNLNDALNNRFYAYEPLFPRKKVFNSDKIMVDAPESDSKQFTEPSRPNKIPKAVQILRGIPDQDS